MQGGLKELMECINALDVAVDTYVKVMEDGKIDFGDVKDLPQLLVAARQAIQGIQGVVLEVKNASPEDTALALVAVVNLVKKIAALMGK